MKVAIRNAVFAAALVYGAAAAAVHCLSDRIVFPGAYEPLPSWIGMYTPSGFARVPIPMPDGVSLLALYRPPDPGRPVVIVFPGDGGYPEDFGGLYKSWAAHGFGVVSPVYRGYPRSPGGLSAPAMLSDALAVHDWATSRHPGSRVYVLGDALGAAFAIHIAAERPVSGVVLLSPFDTVASLAPDILRFLPLDILLGSGLAPASEIGRIRAPILAFSGGSYGGVPAGATSRVMSSAIARKELVDAEDPERGDGLLSRSTVLRVNRFIGVLN